MKWLIGPTTIGLALAAMAPAAHAAKCPADSVKVGAICVDKYEASVWNVPNPTTSNKGLVKKIQKGKATMADLSGGGATQLSPSSTCSPGFPAGFPADGNWTPIPASNPPTPGVYAVSIPGVHPTACVTWFQAEQACLLSGKRLMTNREWQGAASGTPDPGTDNLTTDCAVSSPNVVNTGSRSSCKSNWGVFDMVGNVNEWVADWADNNGPSPCTDWTTSAGIAGNDASCFGGPGGAGTSALPGALFRGGGVSDSTGAGVFAVDASFDPSLSIAAVGFRCVR